MAETMGSTSTRNIVAVVVVSCLYTGPRTIRQVRQASAAKCFSQPHASAVIDFCCDQVVAYFLISAVPPVMDKLREGADNSFTNSSAVSITMTFLAFFYIALSALIYSYKLSMKSSNQGGLIIPTDAKSSNVKETTCPSRSVQL